MNGRRWRTIILVIGTTLSLLIAAAFVASAFRPLGLDIPGAKSVAVSGGVLSLIHDGLYFMYWSPELPRPGLAAWNTWTVAPFVMNIPLYAVFAAVAIPTLLVWRFWRKPPKPGHCRCGYILTGNVSGRCPECGEAVG